MNSLKKTLLSIVLIFPLLCIAEERIDINVADVETLMSIKGIGEKRALAIVDYREQYGPFKSVDDLSEVRGVSESLIERSRELLVVKNRR